MVFENYYLKILAVDMGVQWVAWGVSAALKTERFYDLTGNLFNLHIYRSALLWIFFQIF